MLEVPLDQQGANDVERPGPRRHGPMVARRLPAWVGCDLTSIARGLRLGSAIGIGFILGQYVAEWLR
jgi:hypothetical protein